MNKNKILKIIGAGFLSIAMVATMTTTNFMPKAKAKAETVTNPIPVEQFATKSQLTATGDEQVFGLDSDDTGLPENYQEKQKAPDIGKVGKIKFGDKTWYIAGADTDGSLAVLSTSAFVDSQYYNENYQNNKDSNGNSNNFNTSDILKLLKDTDSTLYSGHFNSAELGIMKNTQVHFYDKTATTKEGYTYVRDSTDGFDGDNLATKLYIPDTLGNDRSNSGNAVNTGVTGEQYTYRIYLGENNTIPVYLPTLTASNNKEVKTKNGYFWLRSARYDSNSDALIASPGYFINDYFVYYALPSLVPASNLNLSSVAFSSEALVANDTNIDTSNSLAFDNGNAMTLRFEEGKKLSDDYTTPEIGGIEKITEKGKLTSIKVDLSKATNTDESKYLVVQTANGAWSKKVTDGEIVKLSDVKINGDSIALNADMQIWLESTHDFGKGGTITTATQSPDLNAITLETDGNGTVTADPTSATKGTKVTLTVAAKNGYEFDKWEVLSGNVTIAADNTFVMGEEDVKIKATFKLFEPLTPSDEDNKELGTITTEKSKTNQKNNKDTETTQYIEDDSTQTAETIETADNFDLATLIALFAISGIVLAIGLRRKVK